MPKPWTVVSATRFDSIPRSAIDSWAALYQRSSWAGCVPNNVAEAVWVEALRQLVARGATMWLAVNPANPDHWLGYLLTERTADGVPVVHLAYTKSNYRRSGVQHSLFTAADVERTAHLLYTFKTGPENRFYPAGRYAPEVARRKSP